ncbi:putative Rho-type GTPase-activating protein 2 [Rhypophila sp. PSN 637]
MGRKPIPQPLTLGDSQRPGQVDDTRAGETVPKSAVPEETRSPRSPRSPFRFGQKKPESAGGLQALQLTDVLQQQQQQPQQSPLHSPQHQQQQRQQYQNTYPDQQRQQEQRRPQTQHQYQSRSQLQTKPVDDPYYPAPPLSSPPPQQLDQRSPAPASQQQQHQHQQAPLGHRHARNNEEKASKSGFFFHFGKSSKSSDRLTSPYYAETRSETMSRDSDQQALSKQSSKQSETSAYPDHLSHKQVSHLPSKSEVSLASSIDYDSKKSKPKPFTILNRTRSIKDQEIGDSKNSPSPKDRSPRQIKVPEPDRAYTAAPLRTAPIQAHDRSFREMMSSAARNHSAERSQGRDSSVGRGRDHHDNHHNNNNRFQPSSLKDNSGSNFLSGLKNSKAAGILNKTFFGTRSEGVPHREPVVDDEHYVLKVLNLPLVEQTRRTRISKRLEESRDKTEFWMPAFPWRAIDYLNYKGSDVEGLYRVPGSGPQIKKWQRKFDEDGDVDLFEQTDLYDINIIGSMLKAWLRELPDELFPKAAQDRIARECAGSETVPQLLIDELSNLSPFNYYLLFAITCHLSLLLAHSDKNKMDFRNLCICFQPCMKIDAFCFKFLVCDWRDCWKGCKNEAKYIEEEYALFDQPPPKPAVSSASPEPSSQQQQRNASGSERSPARQPETERNVSSSDSASKNSNRSGSAEQKGRLRKKVAAENASPETSLTSNATTTPSTGKTTTATVSTHLETPPRSSSELRPLSPIKPLSPLGF